MSWNYSFNLVHTISYTKVRHCDWSKLRNESITTQNLDILIVCPKRQGSYVFLCWSFHVTLQKWIRTSINIFIQDNNARWMKLHKVVGTWFILGFNMKEIGIFNLYNFKHSSETLKCHKNNWLVGITWKSFSAARKSANWKN